MRKTKTFLYIFISALCLCASVGNLPAQVTYMIPQTKLQTAFTAAACAPATFKVLNIGQSAHYVFYTTAGTINSIQMEIDGNAVDTVGTAQPISAVASNPTTGAVSANIYLPFVWVNLKACSGTGTVTAYYVASTVPPSPPSGIFNTSGIFQNVLATAYPANATAIFTVLTPTGSSGGTLYFKMSAAGYSGSSISVSVGPDASHLASIMAAFTPFVGGVSDTGVHFITIPAFSASIVVVQYNTAGATAATFDLSYSFSPGMPTTTGISYSNGVAGATSLFYCGNRKNITITGAGNTEIIPVSAGVAVIYICHLSVAFNSAVDVSVHQGTGVNCAGADSAITGTYPTVSSFVFDFGPFSPLTSSGATAVCLNTSGVVTGGGTVLYAEF